LRLRTIKYLPFDNQLVTAYWHQAMNCGCAAILLFPTAQNAACPTLSALKAPWRASLARCARDRLWMHFSNF
jgi:hypothetical protein